MNSEEIPTAQSAVHLGIERDNSSKFGTKNVSNARISAARKATHALMGAGLHGLNGLNPTVSIHIIRIFIIPRLIHGLEVVRLMISDIKALSSYFKQLLKRIQHLPERTADSATYLLSGQMPIEAEIDKRTLTLFGNIIRNPNTVEFKLAQRQLAIKDRNSKSWFTYVQQLLEKYNLPSSSVLLQEPPGKFSWKNLVSKAIKTYWTNKIHSEAREKSSLQYINFEQLIFDNPHLVWKSAKFEHFSIQRAGIKCRLMLDTYLLQIHKQKFNKYEVDSTCLLCHNGLEDRKHFLIQCVALDSIRSPFLKILHEKPLSIKENIALNKDTLQSSTTTGEANRQAKSSLANDGSSEQNYKAPGGPFCSHTLPDEANYWWALDLGQEYNINTMTIYNRKDCCGDRLADFFIYIYNQQINTWTNFDDEQGQLCFYHNGAAPAVLSIACNRIIPGRFVKIFKEYKYFPNTDALTLCEVEIFADHTPDEGIFCKQINKQAMLSLQTNLENATRIRCAHFCKDSDNCLGFQMANGGQCSLFQTSMQVHGINDEYYERC